MPSPTSPRVFNLYDILGVMVPGVTLLTGLLLFLPNPPAPSEPWEYLLYALVAFSLGYIVQSWASKGVGHLKTFENTIDDVRNLLEPSNADAGSDSDEVGEEDSEDGEAAANERDEDVAENPIDDAQSPPESSDVDSGSDSGEAAEEDGEDGRSTADEGGEAVIERTSKTGGSQNQSHFCKKSKSAAVHLCYSFFGPIIWPKWSPTDQSIGNPLHANRVWRDLRDTYNLERDTDNYEELQQMIQSEVDNVRSPSRSYRFQAIRNFHRGMWISLWIIFVLFLLYFLNEGFVGIEVRIIHGTGPGEPYLLQQAWWRIAVGLTIVSVVAFWWLHVEYQRAFVRYLIIDYFVKLRERGQAELQDI